MSRPRIPTSQQHPADLSEEEAKVLNTWLFFYAAPTEAKQHRAIKSGYESRAVFEDNIVRAQGQREIDVQAYATRLLVDHIEVDVVAVETRKPYSSPKHRTDVYEMEVYSKQKFYLPGLWLLRWLLPEYVSLWVTSTLVVRTADHKILSHVDTWHNLPKLPELLRSALGGGSSYIMIKWLHW